MKRSLLLAVASGLVLSTCCVSAYTNKTFLMPRPQNIDLPMQSTTFHEFKQRGERKFKGNLQISGFYKESTAESDLAKYFLIHGKSIINLPVSANITTDGAPISTSSTVTNDLDLGYIMHLLLPAANATTFNNETGIVKFGADPYQTNYGLRFDYCQGLDAILHGLYFYANTPLVYLENKVRFSVASNPSPSTGALTNPQTTIGQYFRGEYAASGAEYLTQKLTYAKMGGTKTATGFADIDLGLGYTFCNRETHHASIAIALTIPTGNKAKGEYVFEPIYGNGDHFALGADLGGFRRLVGNFEHNLKVNIAGKYRYLFIHNEQRTLGIKGRNFGQYYLLGKAGAVADTPLIPAANLLTMPVDVTPGSQFDGIAGITYNYRGFSADLGYNLYYREAEKVSLRSAFVDCTYYIAARSFDTTAAFTPATTPAVVDGSNLATAVINDSTIDTSVAQTPEQWTNGVYASLGYISSAGSNPWMLGVGGKYESPSRNSALEQWGIWLKAGIGF